MPRGVYCIYTLPYTPMMTASWRVGQKKEGVLWAKAAMGVLQQCAERIDKERRGGMVALWRQRLSVALQREGFRIMRLKVAAALGDPELGWTDGVEPGKLSVDDIDCVPGVRGRWEVEPAT